MQFEIKQTKACLLLSNKPSKCSSWVYLYNKQMIHYDNIRTPNQF